MQAWSMRPVAYYHIAPRRAVPCCGKLCQQSPLRPCCVQVARDAFSSERSGGSFSRKGLRRPRMCSSVSTCAYTRRAVRGQVGACVDESACVRACERVGACVSEREGDR
eukprot:2725969-Pleurochrysis_carterae.AAC.1